MELKNAYDRFAYTDYTRDERKIPLWLFGLMGERDYAKQIKSFTLGFLR